MFNKRWWIWYDQHDDPIINGYDSHTIDNKYLSLFMKHLQLCGFKTMDVINHKFTPQGYTALVLLSESHFAFHSFPEESRIYIELSSCVKEPFDKFCECLEYLLNVNSFKQGVFTIDDKEYTTSCGNFQEVFFGD